VTTEPAGAGTSSTVTGVARVSIVYCTQCRWLMRAAWMAQELLSTFSDELTEVALVPATGGVFRISVGTETIWNRKTDGGFPEITHLKRLVRDRVAPGRSLGHSDATATPG
jgi:selenoprotein W-related protein